MKRLEHMKESLIACVESQISGNLAQVDSKELGEAIDMIKDLEEAIYYCTITKAMKENDEEEKKSSQHQQHQQPMHNQGGGGGSSYYTPMYYPPTMYNDGAMYNRGQNYNDGMMYAQDGNSGGNNANGGGTRGYQDVQMSQERDAREGNSPMRRRMYMEAKQNHDSQKQMKELENYMHELTNDIMEMIEDATSEEKQLLRQKLSTLSTKIK